MKNAVYEWLVEYIKDDKKLVEYLYVLHYFFQKYGSSVNSYLKQFEKIDESLTEILKFFIEQKYQKKDIYNLLQYAIKKTWYNVFDISHSEDFEIWSFVSENAQDIIENIVKNDTWVYIKTADNKIYKRFLLEDVKKLIWI